MNKEMKKGDIIRLNLELKEIAKTQFEYIIIDKVSNGMIDAYFIDDHKKDGFKDILNSDILKGHTICIKLYDILY